MRCNYPKTIRNNKNYKLLISKFYNGNKEKKKIAWKEKTYKIFFCYKTILR